MSIMKRSELEYLFLRFWRKGFGSVSVDDLFSIQELIQHFKPERFLEIGMASGISAGFIAQFLDFSDGRELVTIDHDNTFFGDPEKENGYLVDSIYSGSKIKVIKRPFTTSLDIASGASSFDMAFIDANHQHPWPTIDMLMTLPRMNGSKIIIFDDLDLYKKQNPVIGMAQRFFMINSTCSKNSGPSGTMISSI